ncbi:hypothetical protein J1614_004341 [Plenodomus biglobosus]|nr:hypothetical protein J1614_004341 [Plenodomus biglobosus]
MTNPTIYNPPPYFQITKSSKSPNPAKINHPFPIIFRSPLSVAFSQPYPAILLCFLTPSYSGHFYCS